MGFFSKDEIPEKLAVEKTTMEQEQPYVKL